eukprot:SAG11_NODE_1297_length_5269_cov_3.432302_1_plen_252_part_00
MLCVQVGESASWGTGHQAQPTLAQHTLPTRKSTCSILHDVDIVQCIKFHEKLKGDWTQQDTCCGQVTGRRWGKSYLTQALLARFMQTRYGQASHCGKPTELPHQNRVGRMLSCVIMAALAALAATSRAAAQPPPSPTPHACAGQGSADWRNVCNGKLISSNGGYQDQPQIVVTEEGTVETWSCVFTLNSAHEGEGEATVRSHHPTSLRALSDRDSLHRWSGPRGAWSRGGKARGGYGGIQYIYIFIYLYPS